jgi:hypothetical protein
VGGRPASPRPHPHPRARRRQEEEARILKLRFELAQFMYGAIEDGCVCARVLAPACLPACVRRSPNVDARPICRAKRAMSSSAHKADAEKLIELMHQTQGGYRVSNEDILKVAKVRAGHSLTVGGRASGELTLSRAAVRRRAHAGQPAATAACAALSLHGPQVRDGQAYTAALRQTQSLPLAQPLRHRLRAPTALARPRGEHPRGRQGAAAPARTNACTHACSSAAHRVRGRRLADASRAEAGVQVQSRVHRHACLPVG